MSSVDGKLARRFTAFLMNDPFFGGGGRERTSNELNVVCQITGFAGLVEQAGGWMGKKIV